MSHPEPSSTCLPLGESKRSPRVKKTTRHLAKLREPQAENPTPPTAGLKLMCQFVCFVVRTTQRNHFQTGILLSHVRGKPKENWLFVTPSYFEAGLTFWKDQTCEAPYRNFPRCCAFKNTTRTTKRNDLENGEPQSWWVPFRFPRKTAQYQPG